MVSYHAIRTSAVSTLMVHFCRLVNIAAMGLRCMPVDAKQFNIVRSGSTCGGILSEERKDRKNHFLLTATTFKKHKSGFDFQQIQIWVIANKNKKELRQSPIWKFSAFFLGQISAQFQLSHLVELLFLRWAAFWVLWT